MLKKPHLKVQIVQQNFLNWKCCLFLGLLDFVLWFGHSGRMTHKDNHYCCLNICWLIPKWERIGEKKWGLSSFIAICYSIDIHVLNRLRIITIVLIIIPMVLIWRVSRLPAALFRIKFTHAMVYRSTPLPTTSVYLVISRQNDRIKGGSNA